MSGANNAKTCATCEHAQPMPALQGGGMVCHGGPPTAVIVLAPNGEQAAAAVWPPVAPTEYCGVWKEKAPQLIGAGASKTAQNTGGNPHGKP